VFDLPYRMVEGLTGSIVQLLGLALPIPDHTGMSRRAKTLQVQIPRRARTEPIHLVVDSTGLKVYGEGEWKVRQHGAGKRRTWRKVHFAVDVKVKDVVAVEVTTEQWTDGEVFAGLLEQIDEPMAQIDADGAYDTREVYQAAADCGADLVVPLGRMQYRGRPIIRAPRRWPPLPSRGWPAGNGPRVIITGVSRKMPCIASNNCSEIAWLAGNWKRK